MLAPASRLSREYVWGPGDSYAGVDELVCQFGGSMDGDGQPSDRSKPWWVIQDLCGDAVAVVEKPSSSQAAAVAWQCTYEPYGGVLACRTLRAHPPLWVGHKGLFADNLDAQEFTALSPAERPVLAARLPLHYHVRNRSLLSGEPVYPSDHPEAGAPRAWAGGMGRFLQPDPNATGVGVMESPAWHGEALEQAPPSSGLSRWCGDGPHALSYNHCAPLVYSDPTGLDDIEMAGLSQGQVLAMQARMLQQSMSIMQSLNTQLNIWMMTHYTKMTMAASMAYGLASPDPANPFDDMALLAQHALRSATGQRAVSLLESQATGFRQGLAEMSGLVGPRAQAALASFDAHHLVPVEFHERLSRMGLSPGMFNHPAFGAFIERDGHQLLHRAGYNDWFSGALSEVEKRGLKGADALAEIIRIVKDDAIPKTREFLR